MTDEEELRLTHAEGMAQAAGLLVQITLTAIVESGAAEPERVLALMDSATLVASQLPGPSQPAVLAVLDQVSRSLELLRPIRDLIEARKKDPPR